MLFSFLTCLKIIKVKVPNFVIIKILDCVLPPIFTYNNYDNSDNSDNPNNSNDTSYSENRKTIDPINRFINSFKIKGHIEPTTIFFFDRKIGLCEKIWNINFGECKYYTSLSYFVLHDKCDKSSIILHINKKHNKYYHTCYILINFNKSNKDFTIMNGHMNEEYTIKQTHSQYKQAEKLYLQLMKEKKVK